MTDREMLGEDREGVGEDEVIAVERQGPLVRGEVAGTQEALALADRLFIDLGGGGGQAAGVVLKAQVKAVEVEVAEAHLLEARIVGAEHVPSELLLEEQGVAFVGKIAIRCGGWELRMSNQEVRRHLHVFPDGKTVSVAIFIS